MNMGVSRGIFAKFRPETDAFIEISNLTQSLLHNQTPTWAGTASGGSLKTVALVAVCSLGLLLYGELVDYGNVPDNAYSQGVQELNTSADAC